MPSYFRKPFTIRLSGFENMNDYVTRLFVFEHVLHNRPPESLNRIAQPNQTRFFAQCSKIKMTLHPRFKFG